MEHPQAEGAAEVSDTDKLEPGWYWVKWGALFDRWSPGYWIDGVWWSEKSRAMWEEPAPAVVGPRLTPPDSDAGRG